MAENDQEKTEQPTSRRREEARLEGNVAVSKEVATFFVILGGLIILYFSGVWMAEGILELFRAPLFPFTKELTVDSTVGLYRLLLDKFFIIVLPAFMIPVFGLLAYVMQNGILISPKSLEPSFSKINPISGAKRLFSTNSLAELVKSILKVSVLAYVVYVNVMKEWHTMPGLVDMEVVSIVAYVTTVSFKIMVKTVWVLAFIAVIDYVYQKWHFEQGLKMSKEEIKEESKESEGDPNVKARIRSVQREAARKRMMQAVPEADVVVTNPTHIAVAIKYDREKAPAPVVVAKGQGLVAQKIKELAKEHGVPVVEDKPLARNLYKLVDVGMQIPENLFRAVAELLAYVYRLRKKVSP